MIPTARANVRNPVPPDERSLAAGKAIYEQNCAACHGETGRGDGFISNTVLVGRNGAEVLTRTADLVAGH